MDVEQKGRGDGKGLERRVGMGLRQTLKDQGKLKGLERGGGKVQEQMEGLHAMEVITDRRRGQGATEEKGKTRKGVQGGRERLHMEVGGEQEVGRPVCREIGPGTGRIGSKPDMSDFAAKGTQS